MIGTVGSAGTRRELARVSTAAITRSSTTAQERFRRADVEEADRGSRCLPVVYDSVGKDTFEGSLDCLRPAGFLISFGQASGAVPPFDIVKLSGKGSLYVQRPTLATYIAKREDLVSAAEDLFDVVERGVVKIEIGQTYPLKDAVRAHHDLESRRTTGSTVLIP